jgi:hypothetical protein
MAIRTAAAAVEGSACCAGRGSFAALARRIAESPDDGLLARAEASAGLALSDECRLRDSAEAARSAASPDLETDEIREHLKSGKQVSQLGRFNERRASRWTKSLWCAGCASRSGPNGSATSTASRPLRSWMHVLR